MPTAQGLTIWLPRKFSMNPSDGNVQLALEKYFIVVVITVFLTNFIKNISMHNFFNQCRQSSFLVVLVQKVSVGVNLRGNRQRLCVCTLLVLSSLQ